jgi:hypothetical protein
MVKREKNKQKAYLQGLGPLHQVHSDAEGRWWEDGGTSLGEMQEVHVQNSLWILEGHNRLLEPFETKALHKERAARITSPEWWRWHVQNFKYDPEVSLKKFYKAMIMHEYPFMMVEHDFFVDFIKSLRPHFHSSIVQALGMK